MPPSRLIKYNIFTELEGNLTLGPSENFLPYPGRIVDYPT